MGVRLDEKPTPGIADGDDWGTVFAMLGMLMVLVAGSFLIYALLFRDSYHAEDFAHDLILLALACAALSFALRSGHRK